MTRSAPVAAALLVLGILACGKKEAAPLAPLPPAIVVETAAVEARPVPRFMPLTGTLVSDSQSDVAANASGRVIRTFVERGALVKAGDPLAQLDPESVRIADEEARASLDLSRAQRDLADTQCKRNEQLFAKGVISQDEWDRISTSCRTSESSTKVATARAELAQKNLRDATIRAPFAGMVAERYLNVGEWVQPSTKVAAVVALAKLRLELAVPESALKLVQHGQRVDFEVQAFPGESFSGTIQYVGPSVRSATRDLVVEAVVDNAQARLRPGMFADARLSLPEEERPIVPLTALRRTAKAAHLFVVSAGRIEERVVQLGPERDGRVAILDGVAVGDAVVSRPTDAVRDGVPVQTASKEGR